MLGPAVIMHIYTLFDIDRWLRILRLSRILPKEAFIVLCPLITALRQLAWNVHGVGLRG
jgi:hypothetical protein